MKAPELKEQKSNLETSIEAKANKMLESERLFAIGELSSRLAHDLRNPLFVIKMSVDLLRNIEPDVRVSDAKVIKKLDLISKSVDRISHQVDDVLGFVRNSPLEISTTNLSVIVVSVLDKMNLPPDVVIDTNFQSIDIKCDNIKMEAVFTNLIVNAIQAMDNVGHLLITSYTKHNRMIIEFENTGPAIPDDVMPRIFEPLFTTKQKGTGLGLASCKNILEQHNTSISIKNNPVTFVIDFPMFVD